MTTGRFQAQVQILAKHYTQLLEAHGDSPQAVQWADKETQERRFEVLTQVADLSCAKILDFGCGTGHLLTFLQEKRNFTGSYVGYDVSEKMVQTARTKFPECKFEVRDVLSEGVSEPFDYIIINGTFNNLVDEHWEFMTNILKVLFPCAQKAMAFNAMSTYVDFLAENLSYFDPDRVFAFCKEELSPRVTLRHDYLLKDKTVPYEFAVYVYACDVDPRRNLCRAAEL